MFLLQEKSNNLICRALNLFTFSFRCLAEEKGDVAFIKQVTVFENTDGKTMTSSSTLGVQLLEALLNPAYSVLPCRQLTRALGDSAEVFKLPAAVRSRHQSRGDAVQALQPGQSPLPRCDGTTRHQHPRRLRAPGPRTGTAARVTRAVATLSFFFY